MKNPLILNIRCTCIDEYMELQRIHNNYRKLRSEGEILSLYVGAKRELYGQSKVIDKMLNKVFGDGAKPIPTERIMREEVVGVQGNADGTIAETAERTVVPEPKPEITLTDVLEAEALAKDPMEAMQPTVDGENTKAEGEPDDGWNGGDYNTTYAG